MRVLSGNVQFVKMSPVEMNGLVWGSTMYKVKMDDETCIVIVAYHSDLFIFKILLGYIVSATV